MSDRKRRARLHDIAQIASALREPVETPDFTSSILERVHAEKPFIGKKTRRWVPVVRIGAAAVGLLGVFVMTLIVFVKPDLPEELGAADPSVTCELVQSTEQGFVTSVAALREGVQVINRGADVILCAARETSPASADAILVATTEPADAAFPLRADESTPRARVESDRSLAAVETPLSMSYLADDGMPLMTGATPVAGGLSDYVMFTRGAFEPGVAADARTGAPWQRAAIASQPWRGRPMTYMASPRPRLNLESQPLVQELIPLITGQPVGDELQIR